MPRCTLNHPSTSWSRSSSWKRHCLWRDQQTTGREATGRSTVVEDDGGEIRLDDGRTFDLLVHHHVIQAPQGGGYTPPATQVDCALGQSRLGSASTRKLQTVRRLQAAMHTDAPSDELDGRGRVVDGVKLAVEGVEVVDELAELLGIVETRLAQRHFDLPGLLGIAGLHDGL